MPRLPRFHREADADTPEEKWYEVLFNNSSDGIVVSDAHTGRYEEANPAALKLLGYSRREFLTLTPHDITAEQLDTAQRLQSFQKGELRHQRILKRQVKRKDGRIIPVELVINAFHSAGRLKMLTTFRDLTERIESEEAQVDQENTFRQIMDHMRDVFWLLDLKKKHIVYASPSYETVWGRSRKNLYQNREDWIAAIHPDDRRNVKSNYKRQLLSGTYDVEYRIIRPDGSVRWIRDRAFPIYDSKGKIYRMAGLAEDFTRWKETSEALKESEMRYRSLVQATSPTVFTLLPNGESAGVEVLKWWERLTGTPKNEARGWGWLKALHPEDRESARQAWVRAMQTTSTFSTEYRIMTPKHGYRHVSMKVVPVKDEQGTLTQWVGTMQDITDQKFAEQALKESEAKHRAVVHAIPDCLLRVRADGRITYINPTSSLEIWKRGLRIMTGRNISEIFPADEAAQLQSAIIQAIETEEVVVREIHCYVRRQPNHLEARIVAMGSREVILILRDITEPRRLEREILQIGEMRTRQIGQDLHDGLGQHLTGIAFLSKVLTEELRTQKLSLSAEARRITDLVNEAIAQARDLARGLNPLQLESDGLDAALEQLAANTRNVFRIACTFQRNKPSQIQEIDLSTHIYRIIQEAIHNAVKHGKAGSIRIRANKRGNRLDFAVEDDGIGFPRHFESSPGLGIRTMRYRARTIGANIRFQNSTGPGGRVVLTLPVKE
jgi:PAS domain S-box-containing protein